MYAFITHDVNRVTHYVVICVYCSRKYCQNCNWDPFLSLLVKILTPELQTKQRTHIPYIRKYILWHRVSQGTHKSRISKLDTSINSAPKLILVLEIATRQVSYC